MFRLKTIGLPRQARDKHREKSRQERRFSQALEMLATHPAVLPLLLELGQGAPHLTGMSLIYNPPRKGPPRMTGPYSELHCRTCETALFPQIPHEKR
jgi:hypothetical protein